MSETTDTDTPWEPPIAADEAAAVLGALDRQRATFRYKTDGLDATALRVRLGVSGLTLAGLLKHLAAMEDYYSTEKLSGAPMGEPWASNGWDGDNDWEFSSALEDDPESLYRLYDGAVERSRRRYAEVLERGGLDQPVHLGDGETHANLRRLLLDLVEEYGRHTGHADLLREAVDGRTGEDPTPGWRPVS